MITFVNGRIIRNIELNRAINDAYYTYKPDIKYPIVILNIYTDPTLIDVNIHPTIFVLYLLGSISFCISVVRLKLEK